MPAITSFPGNLEAMPHLAVPEELFQRVPYAQADMLFSKSVLCFSRPSGASTASRAAGSCIHMSHPRAPCQGDIDLSFILRGALNHLGSST